MCATIDLSWLFSPKDYYYAIISAGIGTWLGILWARRQFKTQKIQDEEKVRVSIIDTLKFNKERATQAKAQLAQGGMPNYPLDGARLSSLILPAHGFIPKELLRQLDWHRYQLDHITAKLSVINSFFLTASVSTPEMKVAYNEWLRMLKESLSDHYQQVIDGTDTLINETEKQKRG